VVEVKTKRKIETKKQVRMKNNQNKENIKILMGERFSALLQTDPGTYPDFCAMGTRLFSGVQLPGRGVNHPPYPQSSTEFKEMLGL
jgi:hypothetical protein